MPKLERRIFEAEHEMYRRTVQRFIVDEVVPHRERWREQGIVDRAVWEKAGAAGLLCIWADEKYGGAGLTDYRFDQVCIEEMSYGGDIGFFIALHNRLVGPYINTLGTDEQKARFLPGAIAGTQILAVAMTEPGAGSDLAGMKTRAQDMGDHWLLNGAKTYISNGILADLVVVAARTDPDKSHGVTLFVVERGMAGFSRGRKLKKMGLASQDTAELFFDNVKIPKANVLGEPHKGFYYLMRFLAEERLTSGVQSTAQAERAFDVTLDYVKERRMFGRALGAFQNSRFKLADMRARLDAAQAYVDHCVMLHVDGKLPAEAAAALKLFTSEVQAFVVDEGVQLHGGAGYMDEYEISRLYTDARITRIYAGASEVMKEIISRGQGLDERKMN